METGHENLIAEVERLRRILRARSKAMLIGSLVGTLIHDINNPLTAINGNIELLQLSPVMEDAKVKKRVDTIQTGTKRISEKLRSVQLFTKAGRADMLVDVNEAAREAVRVAEYLPKTTKIPITLDLPEEPLIAAGNANQLALAILYLLDNALDAVAASDGPAVKLRTARTPARELMITIVNNGPMIPAEVGERIFEPFFSMKEAVGLGLSLAYELIVENQGSIDWHSEPAHTEFIIILPGKD